MEEGRRVLRIDLLGEPRGHRLGAFQVRFLRFADERIDEEGLSSFCEDIAHKIIHLRLIFLLREVGYHRFSPGRQGSDRRNGQIAEKREGEAAGDRCGRHHEHVGDVPFFIQGQALHDAEAVLLVDHDELQRLVDHVLGEERVRADDDVDAARGQSLEEGRARRVVHVAGQEGEPHTERLEKGGGRGCVLAGEELGGGHDGGLPSAFNRAQGGQEGHDRLA